MSRSPGVASQVAAILRWWFIHMPEAWVPTEEFINEIWRGWADTANLRGRISELRQLGFEIETMRGVGYRLRSWGPADFVYRERQGWQYRKSPSSTPSEPLVGSRQSWS